MNKIMKLPLLINFEKEKRGIYSDSQLKRDWNNPQSYRGIDQKRFKIFIIDGRKVLQSKQLKGKVGPHEGGGSWKLNLGKKYDELYLQYKVMFPKGFNFVRGGKLPGLSGGTSPGGGSKDTDGFSARVMWRVNNFEDKHKIKNPYKAYLCQYVYYPEKDPSKNWGLDLNWSRNNKKVYIVSGKWHTIKIRVKLSSPRSLIESWFDGKKVLSKSLVLRRQNQQFGIEYLLFSVFFGGEKESWAPKKMEHIYFDDFIISERDIK